MKKIIGMIAAGLGVAVLAAPAAFAQMPPPGYGHSPYHHHHYHRPPPPPPHYYHHHHHHSGPVLVVPLPR